MSDISVQMAHKIVALAGLKPRSIVHDNACGNGVVTLAIIDVTKPSETIIHATDIDPRMCEVTASRAASKGWAGSVKTAVMGAETLIFDDNFFSHSFSNFVIQMARDAEMAKKFASNIYRTLKPGGKAIMTSWATHPHISAVLAAHTATRGPDVFHGMSKVDWKDPVLLKELLEDAGFTDIHVEQKEAVLTMSDLRRWSLIAWSWFGGNCDGGWTKDDEGRFQQAVDVIYDTMLKVDEVETDGKGGASLKMVANIVMGTK